MSFFIQSKRKNNIKGQTNGPISKKSKDDELTSDSEDDSDGKGNEESDDEDETAQEKQLRLAKMYLQEIEKQEQERFDSKDDCNGIADRLKKDYLIQTGKYQTSVAEQYTGVDLNFSNILRSKEHKIAVTCLCTTSDSKYVFSGSKDGSIVKWEIEGRKKVGSLPFRKKHFVNPNSTPVLAHSFPITCIAISSDSKFLAIGDTCNDIQIWNPETLTHIHTLKSHRNELTGLVFRRDTHQLYSCSKDRSVKVWGLDEMSYLETLFGHQDSVTAIHALSRERAITAGGTDTSLRIWKIAEESQLIFNGTGSVDCVQLINEETFVSGGDSGELCIWSTMKKKPLCSVKNAHGKNPINQEPLWICSISTLVNTDLIASGSCDGHIRLWQLSNSFRSIAPLFTIPVKGFVNSLSFTLDGNYLVAGIGQEHRCGRWTTIKEAKNGISIIPLVKLTKSG